MFKKVFIKWSNMAGKEITYYKIQLFLKFDFYEGQ